jgi:hypothetical protein
VVLSFQIEFFKKNVMGKGKHAKKKGKSKNTQQPKSEKKERQQQQPGRFFFFLEMSWNCLECKKTLIS